MEKSKIDLLPCPFCGKTDTAKITTVAECECMDNPTEWDKTHYGAVCSFVVGGCGASTGWDHESPEEAAKAWNTRASGWIPCSERMPDAPGIHVMVTDGVHIMESLYELIDGEMLWLDNSLDLRFGKVTHWMPLPEMPKGV